MGGMNRAYIKKIMVALLFFSFLTVPVFATSVSPAEVLSAGFYEQTFSIEVNVENLDIAVSTVRSLPGHVMLGQRQYVNGYSVMDFTKSVPVGSYATVQNALRSLGEVSNESEFVTRRFDEVLYLQARLTAIEYEIVRLRALMELSQSLSTLITIESHLLTIGSTRDQLLSRLNEILVAVSHADVSVTLRQVLEEEDQDEYVAYIPDDQAFLPRLWNSFYGSLILVGGILGSVAIVVAWISMPIGLLVLIAYAVWVGTKRIRNGYKL